MVLYLFANFYEFGASYGAAIGAAARCDHRITVIQSRVARRWVYYDEAPAD
jgi:hypothetical protein